MMLYTGMKNTSPDYDSVVSKRKRERDMMKIPEILNGKVIHLEHQPALHRPIMHPKDDQPALRRPIMHPEEDWPALCRPIMQPEEDQLALHRPTMHPEEDHKHPMHPEEDEPAIRVYRMNCASVVGISRSTSLFSSLLSRGGNFCPIRGYPTRPDLNGPDFTRSDKE